MNKFFKKTITVSMAAASAVAVSGLGNIALAESAVEYSVPVKLMNANENKLSMGNEALDGPARVVVKDGKASVYLAVKGLSFLNMYGHLWGASAFESDANSNEIPAIVEKTFKDKDLEGKDRVFPKVLKFERNKTDEGEILIKVEVDAMDAISSGGATSYENIKKGSGAQKAKLVLDYSNAKKIEIPNQEPGDVERISGSNRYATAAKISESSFKNADTVVLANGYKEADALAASPMATLYKAPILLSDTNKLPVDTKNEIKRLNAKKIIITGGLGSVSGEVESTLKSMGLNVERVSGNNRYKTSIEIAKKIRGISKDNSSAVLVNGRNFADALAVSSLASRKSAPILLTESNILNADTKKALDEWKLNSVTIVGGKSSVSDTVMNNVKSNSKNRIAGSNRFATSVAVAKTAFPEAKSIIVANGLKAADALAAGAISVEKSSPVVLVDGKHISNDLSAFVKGNGISKVLIVGGMNSVGNEIQNNILK